MQTREGENNREFLKTLQAGCLWKIEIGAGLVEIICCAGTVWITQAGDSRDYLLEAGMAFRTQRTEKLVVQAMGSDAVISCARAGQRALSPALLNNTRSVIKDFVREVRTMGRFREPQDGDPWQKRTVSELTTPLSEAGAHRGADCR